MIFMDYNLFFRAPTDAVVLLREANRLGHCRASLPDICTTARTASPPPIHAHRYLSLHSPILSPLYLHDTRVPHLNELMILVVPNPVHRAGVVRFQVRHMIVDLLREEQLSGLRVASVGRLERAGEEVRGRRRGVEIWRMDFEVDVNGAAGVPSRKDLQGM